MADKVDVWHNRGEEQKAKGQNKQKVGNTGQLGQGQKQTKSRVGERRILGNAVQGKGTLTTNGTSSYGSVATVASGTNTHGQQNQQNPKKKGPGRRLTCPRCGGKHRFQDYPQCKSV